MLTYNLFRHYNLTKNANPILGAGNRAYDFLQAHGYDSHRFVIVPLVLYT